MPLHLLVVLRWRVVGGPSGMRLSRVIRSVCNTLKTGGGEGNGLISIGEKSVLGPQSAGPFQGWVVGSLAKAGRLRNVVNGFTRGVRWKSASTYAERGYFESWSFDLLQTDAAKKSRNQLVLWLGVCSGWVFSLVVIGGITRLTRSGLSMTDWKFTGERPPWTEEEWEKEFNCYKSSPEWMRVNRSMTIDEFKFIYAVEYGHRMWGRMLGLVFAIPAGYFVAKRAISSALGQRLSILFLMGGTQGLVGWWMVKSGLQMPEDEYAVPRVSPHRLATHLMSAFSIYGILFWTTMTVASPAPLLASCSRAVQEGSRVLKGFLVPWSALVYITAASGAFVAGLDAGRAFNTFPLMDGQWIPAEYFEIEGAKSYFESTAAVQFTHRVLAGTTLITSGIVWLASSRLHIHPTTRRLMHGILAATALQVTLGISALVNYVPVSLGALHQAGALTLFTVSLAALHSVRSRVPGKFGVRFGVDAFGLLVVVAMGILTQIQ